VVRLLASRRGEQERGEKLSQERGDLEGRGRYGPGAEALTKGKMEGEGSEKTGRYNEGGGSNGPTAKRLTKQQKS